MKMFAQHKDDRKRIEKALEASHLPAGRVSTDGDLFPFSIGLESAKNSLYFKHT